MTPPWRTEQRDNLPGTPEHGNRAQSASRASWDCPSSHLLVAMFLLATTCCGPSGPNNPGGDTTAPGFITIEAEYIRVSDGLSTGRETIPSTGFTKANPIPRDRRLRLVASVADSESGIAKVLGNPAEIAWICSDGSDLAESKNLTLDPRPDEDRTGAILPTATPALRNATFLVDPSRAILYG
jgi:hypothetical protein